MSGLDLQKFIADNNLLSLPIIFISGDGDIPMSVQAMKSGAVDFLTKPIRARDLLSAVEAAFLKNQISHDRAAIKSGILTRLQSLSPRENDVFALVITGKLNKQIGCDLGIAEKTVKVHRGRIMHKMNAQSLAELVRFAIASGLYPLL
jgi:FixJ family two-component response regulator